MSPDNELDLWRRQWQSENAIPFNLRRRVERQSRLMRIALLADILVTIVIGGGSIAWALRSPQPDIAALAAATWLFLAAAWFFRFRISRGNWSPAAVDTASFIDLSIRRCRASLAAARFGAVLYAVQLAFCLGWIYHHAPQPKRPLLAWLFFGSLSIDIVWVATLAFFAGLIWHRRRKRAELAYLLELRNYDSSPICESR